MKCENFYAGGDSKTLMFVQISPNENDLTETLCSLNFASRVRGIELGPAKKQMDKSELFKYKQMVSSNCNMKFSFSKPQRLRFCRLPLISDIKPNLVCILCLKVEKLRQDLKSKDFHVRKLEDTNYGLEVKIKERDMKNRNLQEKVICTRPILSFQIVRVLFPHTFDHYSS